MSAYSKFLRCLVLAGLCSLVAACASGPRHVIGFGETVLPFAEESGATRHSLYFATTRTRADDPAEFFSGERADGLAMGRIDIAIPRDHQVGQIERPPSAKADPRKHFVVGLPDLAEGRSAFRMMINRALADRPPGRRNVMVFVHGYNTNFSSAVLRMSQFVHDTGFKGVPVLFSWASRAKTIDYVYDLNSALQARFYLYELGLILSQTDAENFGIVAHSMGNLVTLEAMTALERSPNFKPKGRLAGVILASPDVDFDLFVEHMKELNRTKHLFHVLVSGDDRALTLSRRIAGGVSRVGAADPERLAGLGLKVLDLSLIDDKSSANHSKFADSPEIVQLIGRGIREGNTLQASTTTATPTRTIVGDVFKSFTAIPAAVAGGTGGGGVLRVEN